MSKTCKRCSAYIPNGRNFCDAHYEEAMFEYQRDLENYHIEYQNYLIRAEEFENLSVEEKNHLHEIAENETLGNIAGFTGLVLGGLIWFFSYEEFGHVPGIIATVVTTALFYLLKSFLGRIIRAIGASLMWSIGCFAAIFFGWMIIDALFELGGSGEVSSTMIVVSIIVGIVIGFYQEYTGGHHAYGGPVAPSEPSQPSP